MRGFHPGYRFNNRTYTTLAGLMTALCKDCNAAEIAPRGNTFTCYASDRRTVRGVYEATPPKAGEMQTITRKEPS